MQGKDRWQTEQWRWPEQQEVLQAPRGNGAGLGSCGYLPHWRRAGGLAQMGAGSEGLGFRRKELLYSLHLTGPYRPGRVPGPPLPCASPVAAVFVPTASSCNAPHPGEFRGGGITCSLKGFHL